MKYLRTYEALTQKEKEEFAKYYSEPYKTFNVYKLKEDCKKYDIFFINLLREILLHKKISFRCEWCYDEDENEKDGLRDFEVYDSHNMIGQCIDIRYVDEYFWDSDVIVKLKDYDKWHVLYVGSNKKKRVRVFNYIEGPLMEEIKMKKNIEKYNL